MGSDKFRINFTDRKGPPRVAPDPAFPTGKDVDVARQLPACKAQIPYPAEERGIWVVECRLCGLRIGITAAGRPDDPRSVRMSAIRNARLMEPRSRPA